MLAWRPGFSHAFAQSLDELSALNGFATCANKGCRCFESVKKHPIVSYLKHKMKKQATGQNQDEYSPYMECLRMLRGDHAVLTKRT